MSDDDLFDQLSSGFNTDNELLAAMRQAEQQLMNAWRAMNPQDGDHGPSNVQIMQEAWAKLTPEQQQEAQLQLFNAYWHQVKDIQSRADVAAMAKMQGSTFLEDMDLDTLEFAWVDQVDDDFQGVTRIGQVSDFTGIPEEALPKRTTAIVELEVIWRLIQEVKLLQYREQQRQQDQR